MFTKEQWEQLAKWYPGYDVFPDALFKIVRRCMGEPESPLAVGRHLEHCPNCRQAYAEAKGGPRWNSLQP